MFDAYFIRFLRAMKSPRILHPMLSSVIVDTGQNRRPEVQNSRSRSCSVLSCVCVFGFDSFPTSLSFFFFTNAYFKMKTCFVVGCPSGKKANKEKVAKFSVPKDEKQFVLWQKSMPKCNRKLDRKHAVCAKHFEENYIINSKTILNREYPLQCWRLKPEAIPTLNLGNIYIFKIL